MYRDALDTPYGVMHLAVDASGVLIETWLPQRGPNEVTLGAFPTAASDGMALAKQQLREYFEGTRRTFDLQLEARGSAFERSVWKKLLEIPYGEMTSYGAIAGALRLENGARAVGAANGSNPIPIIIPCHRVIGSDGTLTGYGGGLPLKRALLELEGAIPPPDPRLF